MNINALYYIAGLTICVVGGRIKNGNWDIGKAILCLAIMVVLIGFFGKVVDGDYWRNKRK